MEYPDFQMKEFEADTYRYYSEIGLGLNIVKSEIAHVYLEKEIPMHMFCADTLEDAALCVRIGASLITANDPIPLMNYLGRIENDGNS